MRIQLLAVGFFSFIIMLFGCGSEETSDKSYRPTQGFQQQNISPSNQQGISPVMNKDPSSAQPVAPMQNASIAPVSTNIPVNNNQPLKSSAISGLNPEHGQPGHRCDIAVGAPLNSKPTTPASTATINPSTPAQPSIITTPAATTGSKTTAKGLNPEHGQPGHRCDIAVGAPLDSKPTSTTTAPAITTSTPVNPIKPMSVTPVLPAQKNDATMPAYQPGAANTSGLNPEHGKPGHRCDIAVGAPLNSKPTTNNK